MNKTFKYSIQYFPISTQWFHHPLRWPIGDQRWVRGQFVGPSLSPKSNFFSCDDGNSCTTDYCDVITGECAFTGPKECSDNSGTKSGWANTGAIVGIVVGGTAFVGLSVLGGKKAAEKYAERKKAQPATTDNGLFYKFALRKSPKPADWNAFLCGSNSLVLPDNKGYNLLIVDKYGDTYKEFSAYDGSFVESFDNSMLVNPQDIAEHNGILYVTGDHYAITKYNQTTQEFLGYYLNFTYSTAAFEFLNLGGQLAIGVVLHDEYYNTQSLQILNFTTATEMFTMSCDSSCYDLIQNPLNNKILVSTSIDIEQYSWNGSSLVLDDVYLKFSDVSQLSSQQTRVKMHWYGNYLYAGFSNPPIIVEFNVTTSNATFNQIFAPAPSGYSNWFLNDFAFLPGSDTKLAIGGYEDTYQGYLLYYDASAGYLGDLAVSNYSIGALVGIPNAVFVDSLGILYAPDFSWISTWDANSFAFRGQIEHNLGFNIPLGVAYNPLNDTSVSYVTTGNRILKMNRTNGEPFETFVWKVMPDSGDGLSMAGRCLWYNNTFWVQAYTVIAAFTTDGQRIAYFGLPDQMMDIKMSPLNDKMYLTAYWSTALYAMDMASHIVTQIASVTLPAIQSYLAFSPDGKTLYVCSNYYCTGVTAFNTLTWQQVGVSDTDLVWLALDLEVGPDGNVYLYSSDGVFVINGTADNSEYLKSIGYLVDSSLENYRNEYAPGDITFVPASTQATPTPSKGSNKSKSNVALGATLGALGGLTLIGIKVAIGCFIFRRRKAKSEKEDQGVNLEAQKQTSAAELATTMFNQFWEIDFAELEIETEIGRGAFGSVFKGEWRNSVCVVKQLQKGQITKDSIAAFLKEANTVKNLRTHKNVCIIFGVCTNPEKPICIVMEYCNGGNLQAALIQKKIVPTLANLVKIFKDICSGMSHVHREGYIHCDLACRNCLVSFEGSSGEFSIKVTDFGFARALDKDGTVKITDQDVFPIRWCAPELLNDQLAARPVDVWSFGVLMWETIQGETPYLTMSNSQVIEHVCKNHSTLEKPTRIKLDQLPTVLFNIMEKCWIFDATKRVTFDDLIKDFKEMDKDENLKQTYSKYDDSIETVYWTNESGLVVNSNESATSDKYGRYQKLIRSDGISSIAYGNKSL